MNKLTPIDYIEDALSHQPRIILSWVTEGIVINNIRYVIKEFRLKENGKLYAVIAENKYNSNYFEIQLCPDEATLNDIYKSIKGNKVAINKEITDRKNEIGRVDEKIEANITKINQEITDRQNEISRVDGKVTELQGNIKPVVSEDDGLLTVTTEDAQIKLTPKHDSQKQNTLTSNSSIGVEDNTLRQLYTLNKTYTSENGALKTYVKSVSSSTNVSVAEEEFNFIVKIHQGSQEATFTLNEHDKTKFNNIITAYGVDSSVIINGCLFSLSDTTLTVSTETNTGSNYVMSFSDII